MSALLDYFNIFSHRSNLARMIVRLNDPPRKPRGKVNNSACLDAVVFCFNADFATDFHLLLPYAQKSFILGWLPLYYTMYLLLLHAFVRLCSSPINSISPIACK